MQKTDLKVRKALSDPKKSKLQRYQELILGKTDLLTLIKHELIVLLCGWMPGALGLLLRSKLYPLLLGGVGKNVTFGMNVVLRHPHKIFIGDDVVIDDNCLLDAKGFANQGINIGKGVFVGRNTILSCKDGDILLEDGVNIGFNCEIFSSSEVVVGAASMIAAYCYLVGGGNYNLEQIDVSFADQDGMDSLGGIRLGRSVWLAAGVKVLDGVHIGSDSVVGAGAVVSKAIPEASIAVGIPARVVRSRRPAEEAVELGA